MKRFFEIFFCTIFTPALLFSQNSEKNYTIQLNDVGGVLLHPSKITVERNESKIKILYQRKIRTKNSKKLKEELLKNNKNEDQMKRVYELFEKKSKYKNTRIKINKSEYIPYFQLVDSIFQADWQNIKKQVDTKKYIVLDGYTIELNVIKSNTLISTTHFHTSYLKQVPLLSNFQTETLNLFLKIKGKPFQ